MSKKEELSKKYADGIAQFEERKTYCREDFIAGWDAAVDYLANLPLDKMLKYFESVLNDKPFESIIEDVKRLKDK